jgi:hypothetical protein
VLPGIDADLDNSRRDKQRREFRCEMLAQVGRLETKDPKISVRF